MALRGIAINQRTCANTGCTNTVSGRRIFCSTTCCNEHNAFGDAISKGKYAICSIPECKMPFRTNRRKTGQIGQHGLCDQHNDKLAQLDKAKPGLLPAWGDKNNAQILLFDDETPLMLGEGNGHTDNGKEGE